jgi:PPOX class probable F420-dependent enzyme
MSVLPHQARELLAAGHLGHIVTVNPDGSPHVTIVWIGLDGDDIVSAHLTNTYRKIRNIQHDPRVSISVEFGTVSKAGQHHYLVAEGTARLTEGGAPALLQRFAHIYLGPDVTYPGPDAPAGFVLRTTPTKVRGVFPWEG